MGLTLKSGYGLRALVELAKAQESGHPKLSVKEILERQEMPKDFLEKNRRNSSWQARWLSSRYAGIESNCKVCYRRIGDSDEGFVLHYKPRLPALWGLRC